MDSSASQRPVSPDDAKPAAAAQEGAEQRTYPLPLPLQTRSMKVVLVDRRPNNKKRSNKPSSSAPTSNDKQDDQRAKEVEGQHQQTEQHQQQHHRYGGWDSVLAANRIVVNSSSRNNGGKDQEQEAEARKRKKSSSFAPRCADASNYNKAKKKEEVTVPSFPAATANADCLVNTSSSLEAAATNEAAEAEEENSSIKPEEVRPVDPHHHVEDRSTSFVNLPPSNTKPLLHNGRNNAPLQQPQRPHSAPSSRGRQQQQQHQQQPLVVPGALGGGDFIRDNFALPSPRLEERLAQLQREAADDSSASNTTHSAGVLYRRNLGTSSQRALFEKMQRLSERKSREDQEWMKTRNADVEYSVEMDAERNAHEEEMRRRKQRQRPATATVRTTSNPRRRSSSPSGVLVEEWQQSSSSGTGGILATHRHYPRPSSAVERNRERLEKGARLVWKGDEDEGSQEQLIVEASSLQWQAHRATTTTTSPMRGRTQNHQTLACGAKREDGRSVVSRSNRYTPPPALTTTTMRGGPRMRDLLARRGLVTYSSTVQVTPFVNRERRRRMEGVGGVTTATKEFPSVAAPAAPLEMCGTGCPVGRKDHSESDRFRAIRRSTERR